MNARHDTRQYENSARARPVSGVREEGLRRFVLASVARAQSLADVTGAWLADLGYLVRHRNATGSVSDILVEVIKSLNPARRSVFVVLRISGSRFRMSRGDCGSRPGGSGLAWARRTGPFAGD
jgi:hypothetical protein